MYTCSRCCYFSRHREALDRHWARIHGPKRRCGWGWQFVFPEVQEDRYQAHLVKRHAGKAFKPSIPVGRRAPGVKKTERDVPIPVPDCINSEDPLGLEESWEKEPEDGFIVLEPDQSDRTPTIPLARAERQEGCNWEDVINGMPKKSLEWKLIPIDVDPPMTSTRDPRLLYKVRK